jgi:glucose/mannose-6-phosphate isomerase
MHKVYDKWPEIAKEHFKKEFAKIDVDDIDHIVFAGMGGSGSIGDVFSAILSKTRMHVSVVKGYHLPSTVNSNTLVVTTSVSGDTLETLTVLDSARKTKNKIIAFSSGGKMEEYCKKYKLEHRKISLIHSPRASFTAFLYGMLNVIANMLPLTKNNVLESISSLENLNKEISSSNLTKNNPALDLAYWITGIPLIYYPWGLQSAAIRFKNSLQENAKIHVIAEDVVESCHNGIVSWERPSNVQPILLEGKDDYIKTKERWEILKEYFKLKGIDYKEIHSISGSILSKITHFIYLLDYASLYHAVITKTDPSPINSIEFVKSRI